MRLRSSIKMRINEGINERDISIRFVKETIEQILIHKSIEESVPRVINLS